MFLHCIYSSIILMLKDAAAVTEVLCVKGLGNEHYCVL